jgi:large subunit ribosomal protein L28
MAHRCQISGVARQTGHRVSHANNKTPHTWKANLQEKRIFVPSLKKFLRVKITTRMIRTIDKVGFEAALRQHGKTLADIS